MDRPLSVLMTGSRTWTDGAVVEQHLRRVASEFGVTAASPRPCLMHGGAKGADALAAAAAQRLGWRTLTMEAHWHVEGRAAGILRNGRMLEAMRPDIVLAFRYSGESRGTDDMVRRALAFRIMNAHLQLVRIVRRQEDGIFAVEDTGSAPQTSKKRVHSDDEDDAEKRVRAEEVSK